MPTLKSITISSPRPCAPFCGRSGTGGPRTRRAAPSSSGQGGCGRPLDRVAGWVGGGIAAAFFASLERCSCVNVRTHDDLDDEQRDSVAPLMFDVHDNGGAAGAAAGAAAGRRGRRRGRSRRNEKGKWSGGGGIGCYGDFDV